MQKSEYDIQAENFLKQTNTDCKIHTDVHKNSDSFYEQYENATFRDIDRLYMGNVVGVSGYFPPSRAIQNLKQSFVILNIPITRCIALSFKECLEYA